MSEKLRVMVVDDNDKIRNMISEYIKMQDFAVVVGEACNGIETIENFRNCNQMFSYLT